MALLVPVVFGLLLALNLLIWSRYRINYVFIFGSCILSFASFRLICHPQGLDVRTALDPHEYLEVRCTAYPP
jgi:hypothetical protein